VVKGLFESSMAFFSQEEQAKLQSSLSSAYGARPGYTPKGKESVARSISGEAPPDLSENFVFHQSPATEDTLPSEPQGFRPAAQRYWQAMESLTTVLHRVSELALDLEPGFFDEFYTPRPGYFLRLAYYPPLNTQPVDGQLRYGAHTDYQGFTILRQDPSRPGLEIQMPSGDWQSVATAANDNALIINIGDLMERWTNRRWKSTMHRVNLPSLPELQAAPRLSLVFFTGPREDAVVEVLPTCVDPDTKEGQFPPIRAGEHLREKVRRSNI